jgi:hypothetical protein
MPRFIVNTFRDCRSRIKLAERLQCGGAVGGSCKPVPLFQQDLLAWETARELVEASLSDDAITLAIAYQMDLSMLAVLLTRGCIETTNAASHAQAYTTSSFCAEAKSSLDLSCHEAWSTLQVNQTSLLAFSFRLVSRGFVKKWRGL